MLTHVDHENKPKMVDVSDKAVTVRMATASARILFPEDLLDQLMDQEIYSAKGPVFATAIVAGTMAVKKTSDLIPFCHPLAIEGCQFEIRRVSDLSFEIFCMVKVSHKTGVEMEALTGATVAALVVYDMCKALSHEIRISDIGLLEKTGGKSDFKKV